MSQISPPIRIVLVATIGLIAAWMLFLRPSADVETSPPPAAPGVTGLSNAVDGAKDAAAAQEARDGKVQSATGEEAGSKAEAAKSQATAAKALATGRVLTLSPLAKADTKGLPTRVSKALARRDVIAIGVFNTRDKAWAPMAADDRRVRRALRNANRYDGRVTLHSATLRDLTKLRPVIGDLNVSQSPSVIVVDRNRKATVLEGYVDRVAINQAIADARRNTIAFRIKDRYLSRLNDTCAKFTMQLFRPDVRKPRSRAAAADYLEHVVGVYSAYQGRFAALKAPARHRGLKSQFQSMLRRDHSRLLAARRIFRGGDFAGAIASLSVPSAASQALDKRLDSTGVTSCVGFRRS